MSNFIQSLLAIILVAGVILIGLNLLGISSLGPEYIPDFKHPDGMP